ncbi:MAG: hypothetical protein HUU45_06345 [Leptospiraceae bacterium]|nr:hypothetical protein [Leptospiraceae bacterium]
MKLKIPNAKQIDKVPPEAIWSSNSLNSMLSITHLKNRNLYNASKTKMNDNKLINAMEYSFRKSAFFKAKYPRTRSKPDMINDDCG